MAAVLATFGGGIDVGVDEARRGSRSSRSVAIESCLSLDRTLTALFSSIRGLGFCAPRRCIGRSRCEAFAEVRAGRHRSRTASSRSAIARRGRSRCDSSFFATRRTRVGSVAPVFVARATNVAGRTRRLIAIAIAISSRSPRTSVLGVSGSRTTIAVPSFAARSGWASTAVRASRCIPDDLVILVEVSRFDHVVELLDM